MAITADFDGFLRAGSVRAVAVDEKPNVRGGVLVETLNESNAWVEEGKATLHFMPGPGYGWIIDFDDNSNHSRPMYVRLMLGSKLAKLLGLENA